MGMKKNANRLLIILIAILMLAGCGEAGEQIIPTFDNEWNAEVYPAEHEIKNDTTSGAKLIYVTSHSGSDVNLYFDYNCWFKDLSTMFFISNRNDKSE